MKSWTLTPDVRRKIESAALNTTATATMIASWIPGAPVQAIAQIVADVRGAK